MSAPKKAKLTAADVADVKSNFLGMAAEEEIKSEPSFSDHVTTAQATDALLLSMKTGLLSAIKSTDTGGMLLPRLGSNPTQIRFVFNSENRLPMMSRVVNQKIWEEVQGLLKLKSTQGLSITGPQGIGKSHALYFCVCVLRLFRSKVRVTYLQSCEEWVKSHGDVPYIFLLRELCETFMDDEISTGDKKTIADWAEWVLDARPKEREERFQELHLVLNAFVKAKKLRWISVFDQENGLHSDRLGMTIAGVHAAKHYPFNLAGTFSEKV